MSDQNGTNNGNKDNKNNKKDNDKEEEDDRSVAEVLIDLINQNSNLFFKDQYETPFVRVLNGDHHEVIRIGTDKFKRYLGKLYYDSEHRVPYTEALTNAVQVLQAEAEYKGDTVPLSLRVAWYNGDIYYDLTNEKWQCVRITKQGWQVLDETPTPIFTKYNAIAQVQPDRNYEPDIFDRFMGLTNLKKVEDKILLKVYIVSLFVPGIQHAALQIHGEKGGAKSMLETLIKLLVDPSKLELLTIHKDRMEFIMQLAHNYLVFYDNLKYIPGWLSDEVCRAVTGSAGSKRKLYSDDDDIIYQYRRCLGFNGINLVLTEPDVLDRSIVIEQDRIEDENRRQEEDIMSEFYNLRPKLVAYIFDILVEALKIKSTIKLKRLPRLADFAIWGEAIARAMGYKDLEFANIYHNRTGEQNIEAIENNVLGQVISKFISFLDNEQAPKSWQGPMSKTLEELNRIAFEHNIDTTSKSWPKAANSLSRKLKPLLSNLRDGLGVNIAILRNTAGNRKVRGTYFLRIGTISSPSSLSSPEQNHAQNEGQDSEKVKILTLARKQYLHQNTPKITLKTQKVKMVKVVKIFSEPQRVTPLLTLPLATSIHATTQGVTFIQTFN